MKHCCDWWKEEEENGDRDEIADGFVYNPQRGTYGYFAAFNGQAYLLFDDVAFCPSCGTKLVGEYS